MKKILTIIIFGMLMGCQDYLDIQPTDMKTEEMVWTNRSQSEAFLYNLYAPIHTPTMNYGYGFSGISDEIDYTWNVYPSYNINLGNWNPQTNFQNRWGNYYKAIRGTFMLENNIDRNPELSEELKVQYKAEAKFLRGYYYWLLIQQYGPVPLITEERALSEDWDLPRAPYDEIVDYIVTMMDEAKQDLPERWQSISQQWIGKPDKLICNAIKAEVLTTAASPQWNGNPAYSTFQNIDGTSLVSTQNDQSKWARAAEANRAVIEMASSVGVKLYRNNENGDGGTFNPFKSIRGVYFSWNPEIVWGKSGYNPTGFEIHASPGPNNLGGAAPTQRVVDAFFMENGKWIDDPGSGYVETGFATEGGDNFKPDDLDVTADRVEIINSIINGVSWGHWPGDWNMYANRSARFYASILYNKRIIPQLPTDAVKRNYYSSAGQADGYGRAEFYLGGMSRQSGAYTFYPRTGYLVLKRVDFKSNMRDRIHSTTNRPQILVRYAKVLLDYVESLNEVDPTHPDIADYWNKIRDRAGIPDIFDVYPEIRGDKDLQREHILRERQVELAFDLSFDRYFTMKRRLLAGSIEGEGNQRKYGDGGTFWGMNINAGDASTNSFETTSFYERTAFEERVFQDKMYLFPIPQSEIDRDPNLVQNPGW